MLARTLGEDIELHSDLAADPATVLADAVELDQVVLNLVVNARDAVGPGGNITVGTELVVLDHRVLPNLSAAGPVPYVRLTVTDDGEGMAPDVLDHAFEPFFTTKGRGQGTGLGLSTVYGIVQRQGGHVVAHSVPGAGTTIEVLLPAAVPAPVAAEATLSDQPVSSGGGRTVLVVEDEEPLRDAMRRMLERAGFTVLEAEDGTSALERHAGARVDLLLTDIVMPGGVTGVDVADGFRARAADLPVVYVTGYSDDILDPERLDGSTRTALLSKPFTESDLLEVVGATLGTPA
jgi:CheY-like chemotaxis protein